MMINLLLALASLSAVLAETLAPPTTGKYFYADYYQDSNTGFHETNTYAFSTKQHFWMMI